MYSSHALARQPDRHVYERVLQSNLQPEEKSSVARWMADALGSVSSIRVQDAPGGILSALRAGSESGGLGIGLAYLHVNLPTGLDFGNVPVDGASGAALLAASAFMGHSELGSDARNLGAAALTICTYRKMVDVFARARMASGRKLGAHLMPNVGAPGAPDDPVAGVESEL
jgi:hypothetical protein